MSRRQCERLLAVSTPVTQLPQTGCRWVATSNVDERLQMNSSSQHDAVQEFTQRESLAFVVALPYQFTLERIAAEVQRSDTLLLIDLLQEYPSSRATRFSTEIVQTIALPMKIRRLNPNAVSLAQVVAGLQDRQEKVQLRTPEESQLGQSQARANGLLTALYNTRDVQVSPETAGK